MQETLLSTLTSLPSNTPKTRTKALDQLKRILRSNKTPLDPKIWKAIFDALFCVISLEKTACADAKKHASAEARLADAGNVFRLAVEGGCETFRGAIVRVVLGGLVEEIKGGGIARGEFVKSLKVLCAFQVHVENMNQTEWGRVVVGCVTVLRGEGNTGVTGLKGDSTVVRQIRHEVVVTLGYLTAATNAPVITGGIAGSLLGVLVEYLRDIGQVDPDAFAVVNNVLWRVGVDDTELACEAVPPVVRVVRMFWGARRAALRDEMLATLLIVRPYIAHLVGRNAAFGEEVDALLGVMRSEYSKRVDEMLQLGHVQLGAPLDKRQRRSHVGYAVFRLRCLTAREGVSGARQTERCWATVTMLAFLSNILRAPAEEVVNDEDETAPRKRPRVATQFEDLLSSVLTGTDVQKIASLQTLAFLMQETAVSTEQLSSAVKTLLTATFDGNNLTSSWAFVALASCASQLNAVDPSLETDWTRALQSASQAMSNPSTCRASCHLLAMIIRLKLLPQPKLLEFIQSTTSLKDMVSPLILCDSVLYLLRTVLEFTQQSTDILTAESMLSWFLKIYTPSYFEDRTVMSNLQSISAGDIIPFLNTILGHQTHFSPIEPFHLWESIAQTILSSAKQHKVISYLLLLPEQTSHLNPQLNQTPISVTPPTRKSRETTLLDHLILETQKLSETWPPYSRTRHVTKDLFALLCDFVCVVSCISHCYQFSSTAKQASLKEKLSALWEGIDGCVSDPELCPQENMDVMLLTASQLCGGISLRKEDGVYKPTECERVVCAHILAASGERDKAKASRHLDAETDLMELSEETSQNSRREVRGESDLRNEMYVRNSLLSLRSTIHLYSITITKNSSRVVEHILKLPIPSFAASSRIIARLPSFNIHLSPRDVERILDHSMREIGESPSAYLFQRSEVVLLSLLSILTVSLPVWTNSTNEDLSLLAEDIVTWFTNLQKKGVLSAQVETKLGQLLLDLCNNNNSNNLNTSPQGSLFSLFTTHHITTQVSLSTQISRVFDSRDALHQRETFSLLRSHLAEDVSWFEGMAVRLLILSNLAVNWPSLRRVCVYYLFETAGLVGGLGRHAAHCILKCATGLGFNDARGLFTLFAPQLVYSWLGGNEIAELPYRVFGYGTLREMVGGNEGEVTAQLLQEERRGMLTQVAGVLGVSVSELVARSVGKCAAYAISWDITTGSKIEGFLQGLFGGKEVWREMLRSHHAVIIAQFYLSLQLDEMQCSWLGKREEYRAAKAALDEMGYSVGVLQKTQQPSFKARYLPDQVERLCRRTDYEPTQALTSSSFAQVVRILLNNIQPALGPQDTCVVLRKLQILICMSGEVAFQGHVLELIVHSIRPFLSSPECLDDVLGLLQFLFHHGRRYFQEEGFAFANGLICLAILQMRELALGGTDEQNLKLEVFQTWLIQYLSSFEKDNELVEVLGSVSLPGDASKGSAQSRLLLLLLDRLQDGKIRVEYCIQSLRRLTKGFKNPLNRMENCLGDDDLARRYAGSLWYLIQDASLDEGFTVWASQVIGRAYAATGLRPEIPDILKSKELGMMHTKFEESRRRSQQFITDKIVELLLSSDRTEAGLADWTLRRIVSKGEKGDRFSVLVDAVEGRVIDAVREGTMSYQPPLASGEVVQVQPKAAALWHPAKMPDEEWMIAVAVTLCQWAATSPVLSSLPPLLKNVPGLAAELLPPMIHTLIIEESDTDESDARDELTASAKAHLSDDAIPQGRQRFFIRLLLYLRTQPLSDEYTKSDRLRWLDVDLLDAAQAAARCNMPTAALLLITALDPSVYSARGEKPRSVPDDLLLSIFKQIEEPDSFYGVQRPASLDSVMDCLDYEGAGFKSLMFRSAQLDNVMRMGQKPSPSDTVGLMRSLSVLNLNSLEYALLSSRFASPASEEIMNAAQRLQQWDVPLAETSCTFRAFQELTRAVDKNQITAELNRLFLSHVSSATPSVRFCNALATLTELNEVLESPGDEAIKLVWAAMRRRCHWARSARDEDFHAVQSDRLTTFSVLARNPGLLRDLHISERVVKFIEIENALSLARSARESGFQQEALSVAVQLGNLADQAGRLGWRANAAVKAETATVLWETGQLTASVKMLQELDKEDVDVEDIPVGKSGLLAQLGHQLAEARLLKPDEILSTYLQPAIKHLGTRNRGREAGRVFHVFASFCHQQLQNPAGLEDFKRIEKLREKRHKEIESLENLARSQTSSRSNNRGHDASRALSKAKKWFDLDNAEYQRLKSSRDGYVVQSLQNYMLALTASDEHDIDVLSFFAMWLENASSEAANKVVAEFLPAVPSWKFAVLINQLMSRLGSTRKFQEALKDLITRIVDQHPYHGLHQLFAATRIPQNADDSAMERYYSATEVRKRLQTLPRTGEILKNMFEANRAYHDFSLKRPPDKKVKLTVRDFPPAAEMISRVRRVHVPPATLHIPLSPSGDYTSLPTITHFSPTITIMGGLSAPKSLTTTSSDGSRHKQLFKGGDDDLRQDSIMEQVFAQVSSMLQKHKATRLRNLHVRTYKVIPLSPRSGIIEFVPNSIPIGEFLKPAHAQYTPKSTPYSTAFRKIRGAEKSSLKERVSEYRKICDATPPVMRHFFLERFAAPEGWFDARMAYTRTTAAISILGYTLGLGDRHCQNILLDEVTGEVVHIDLGVAFEAGRVLPIPETVPFRLTRDVVDGMGGAEGVFRRCCEFTLEALRMERENVMVLLNVLRWDPLYSWTLSPLRVRRMMDTDGAGEGVGVELPAVPQEEGGEADRALSIVEKKLGGSLSAAAAVRELIQSATDERNLAVLFAGWSAWM